MAKNDKVKMFVCSMNLRPRVAGKPVLFEAGVPFDGAVLDKESLEQMIKAGTISACEAPAPETKKTPAPAPKVPPKGIWDFKREEMEKLDVVTLNALYKERADENGIEVNMVEDKDELLDILCSEA